MHLPDTVPPDDRALVDELVQRGALKPAQLEQALELHKTAGGDLKEVLVRLGFIRERAVTQLVAARSRMHFVDPEEHEVDEDLLARIPREVVERHLVLPLRRPGDEGREADEAVLLAVSDPNDFTAADEVQFVAARSVEAALAPRGAIKKALAQFYARGGRPRPVSAGASASAAPVAEPAAAGRELRQRVADLDGDTLLRALVLALADEHKLSLAKLVERADELAGKRAAGAGLPGGPGGAGSRAGGA